MTIDSKPNFDRALTFKGWHVSFTLKKPQEYRTAFFKYCNRDVFYVSGEKVRGASLSHACDCLKHYAQLNLPSLNVDREEMFKALGFRVAEGLNSRNQSCTVIYI